MIKSWLNTPQKNPPISVKIEPRITILPPDTVKETEDMKFSHRAWQTHQRQAQPTMTEPYRLSGRRVSLGGKVPIRKPSP